MKKQFFGGFWDAPPARPLIVTLIFFEMKGVEVVHISGMFHLHLTCGSEFSVCKCFRAGIITPPTPLSFPLEE